MSNTVSRLFVNELEHSILMEAAQRTEDGLEQVRVLAVGPLSHVSHTWTRMEARVLRDMLCELLGTPEPSV